MGILLTLSALPAWYGLREASYGFLRGWVILGVLLLWDLLLFYLIYSAWKSLRTARDVGLLTERITAIHSGDLSRTLALPKDADLCRAAEELADIQSGLESALRERTKSERMKVELISNVSHDLKTPLTSVLSYASLLAEEDLPGAAGDYARIILEKARRLDTMVQDVFSISKAAAGQLRLKPERLDLGKLLRQTLADMEDAIAQSGLTIKAELPEQAVEIVADGDRLYRVFQNLVQNALQYSLPGSRIHLTLRLEQGQALAVLRNTSARELPEGMDFTARFVRGMRAAPTAARDWDCPSQNPSRKAAAAALLWRPWRTSSRQRLPSRWQNEAITKKASVCLPFFAIRCRIGAKEREVRR